MMTLLIVLCAVVAYLVVGAVVARALAARGVIDVDEDIELVAAAFAWPYVMAFALVIVAGRALAVWIRGGDQ